MTFTIRYAAVLVIAAALLYMTTGCAVAQLPEGIDWHRVGPNTYVGGRGEMVCVAQVDDTGALAELACKRATEVR